MMGLGLRSALCRNLIVLFAVSPAIGFFSFPQTLELLELKEVLARAEKGDPEAQFRAGQMYAVGIGTKRDYAEALKWFRKATDQGNLSAMTSLGGMYLRGEGIAQDTTEGFRLLHKAVEGGLPRAYALIGMTYYDGLVVPKNHAEAAKWMRAAAERGDKGGAVLLGHIYLLGDGVPKNYVEAAKWLHGPADQGFKPAQRWLGMIYYNKDSPIKNQPEAARWFRRAANQGDVPSQISLAAMYWLGHGVPQDDIEAYKWFNLAGAQENKQGQENRDILASNMTREQIAEAQRRSSAFRPRTEADQAAPENSIRAEVVKATGSAFFISADGYLLTNLHVVAQASRIVVRVKEATYEARLIKADSSNDIALLKVSGSFEALAVTSSRGVKLGNPVFTIGYPSPDIQGVEPKLTKGDISSLAGIQDDPRHFQVSVPVQPGNSGGPLLDQNGNVIGIITLRLNDLRALSATGSLPQNVNYALKSSFVIAMLESVPEVAPKFKAPNPPQARAFEVLVKQVQEAVALLVIY